MTSDDGPVGKATARSIWSDIHKAYKVFDGEKNGNGWATVHSTTTGWIAYEFATPTRLISASYCL